MNFSIFRYVYETGASNLTFKEILKISINILVKKNPSCYPRQEVIFSINTIITKMVKTEKYILEYIINVYGVYLVVRDIAYFPLL